MPLLEAVDARRLLRGQGLWFAAWIAITLFGLFLTPDPSGHGTHQHLGFPPCPSVMLFNRPCPGCGLTTSWTALLHGQFGTALHAHAFGPALYLVFTISAVASGIAYFRRTKIDIDGTWLYKALATFVAVFVLFGLIRFAITPNYGTANEQFLARFLTGK